MCPDEPDRPPGSLSYRPVGSDGAENPETQSTGEVHWAFATFGKPSDEPSGSNPSDHASPFTGDDGRSKDSSDAPFTAGDESPSRGSVRDSAMWSTGPLGVLSRRLSSRYSISRSREDKEDNLGSIEEIFPTSDAPPTSAIAPTVDTSTKPVTTVMSRTDSPWWSPREELGPRKRLDRLLLWVVIVLSSLVVLCGAILAGPALGGLFWPGAGNVTPGVPASPGVHAWSALQGGECIQPFSSAWAAEFTVVECASSHAAQLVRIVPGPVDSAVPFPGEQALGAEASMACRAPDLLGSAALHSYNDLQVQASFPVTAGQWDSGARNFYCFVSRHSGQPLNGSLL